MTERAYYPSNESPGLVKTIAVMTLINGIVNIFWGLIATVSVTASIFLICLAPLAILPTILGIFEIIYAAKLLTSPPQPVRPSNTIAILEILCILTFNVFSMIVGILSLVFYNDPQVKDYFARLNGIPYPVARKPPFLLRLQPRPNRPTLSMPFPRMKPLLKHPSQRNLANAKWRLRKRIQLPKEKQLQNPKKQKRKYKSGDSSS